MARLMAQANLEYFPTQERIRPIIRSYLDFPEKGTNCLDPCCGPGDALVEICPKQRLYGIELHTGRALDAKKKPFEKVMIGPFEKSVISNRAFGFIHLNPPYDWVAGGKERYEENFLYRATNYLANNGVLEYLVPASLFKYRGLDVYRFLLENYRDIQMLKYPEPEYAKFKQIVIFGVKKPHETVTASPEWYQKMIAKIATADLPVLEKQTEPMYTIPAVLPAMVRTFRVDYYDDAVARNESKTMSILGQSSKPVIKDKLVAPYYLDKALLALLAVGGYVNGSMPGHFLLGKYDNHEQNGIQVDSETGETSITTRKVSTTVFYALCKSAGEEGSRIVEIK